MNLGELTYPEVRDLIARGAVALWPIGSTEAHGPHLPLNTDVLIAEHTALAALDAIRGPAVVAPALALTVTEFAKPFSGTLSLPRDTAFAVVRDGALALAAQGFSAVCLVNAHLEPAHRYMLRDAVKAANLTSPCPIGIADPADARWAATLTPELASGSCHAGQYETSLVMAARPELVRPSSATLPRLDIDLVARIKGGAHDFAEAGATDAYCGAPGDASVAEGESSYRRLAEITAQVVAELLARTQA